MDFKRGKHRDNAGHLGVKLAVLLLLFLSIAPYANAAKLNFVGELRERFEILDGMNKKAYGDSSLDAKGNEKGRSYDNLLVHRLMAGFVYEQSPRITWRLIGYDARVWGWSLDDNDFVKNAGTPDEYEMNPQKDYFELFNAHVELKDFLVKNLTAKLGRQRIVYGDKRIIGPGSWGNSMGWLWDAAKFSYKMNGNFIDTFYGQTKDKNPHTFSLINKHVYEGFAVYSHFKTTRKGAVEPFYVWKHSLRPAISNGIKKYERTHHFGVRMYEKDYHGFNYDLTFAKELGKNGSKDVNAYAYVVKAGYQFKQVAWQPKVILGRVFASGDKDPSDGTIKTYTRPFGSTDGSHYGRMDIMSWSNLVDNQVNLHLYPNNKTHLKLSYHNFNLDEANDSWSYYKYTNKAGNSYTHLGDEYDIQLSYNYSKKLGIKVIYAYFNAGDFVKNNVEDNDAQRLFLQFTYRFNFKLR